MFKFTKNIDVDHSNIVSKSQGLTFPRTGDITRPENLYYFAMSRDFQAGNLAHSVGVRWFHCFSFI